MVNGFFKTVGYISTKVQNINNSKKIINPTAGFIKSLDEGYNLAKLETVSYTHPEPTRPY